MLHAVRYQLPLWIHQVSMVLQNPTRKPAAPEQFIVEVCSELPQATMQHRWQHVNVLLRLSMMAGLQMQLDATLNLLCDYAREIISSDKALVYFWNEADEQSQLRISPGIDPEILGTIASGNILDYWCMKFGKPMLVQEGKDPEADKLLNAVGASSAAVIPVLVNNRVMGSMQYFSKRHNAFDKEDAQLLWALARVAENVLARERANEGLILFAFTDHLTGLRSRGYFEQQLELEVKRSERKQQEFVLLMLDIDHFKCLNDTYGHHIGDQVLRQVARVLMEDMREVDTVARYGGEEFVIILPETTEEEGFAVAQRIRKAMENSGFTIPAAANKSGSPQKENLSISIGLSVFGSNIKNRRELVESADAALYAAKNQGRNTVVKHSDIAKKRAQEVS
ncbi:MAG: diguanylate cyclase [Acidobacteriales bacterium]|nr:diguanylate cyclase [Terriglobales bacterium]